MDPPGQLGRTYLHAPNFPRTPLRGQPATARWASGFPPCGFPRLRRGAFSHPHHPCRWWRQLLSTCGGAPPSGANRSPSHIHPHRRAAADETPGGGRSGGAPAGMRFPARHRIRKRANAHSEEVPPEWPPTHPPKQKRDTPPGTPSGASRHPMCGRRRAGASNPHPRKVAGHRNRHPAANPHPPQALSGAKAALPADRPGPPGVCRRAQGRSPPPPRRHRRGRPGPRRRPAGGAGPCRACT